MKNKGRIISFAVSVLLAVGMLLGCSSTNQETALEENVQAQQGAETTEETSAQEETEAPVADAETATDEAYEPVTITNGDRTVTFTQMPQKTLCFNVYAAENMLSLGLGDHIAATVEMTAGNTPLPANADAFYALPTLGEKSHELALGFDPDFVMGQVSSFTDKAWGTTEMFEEKGIQSYIISGTIVEDETIENIYEDLSNLGKIFKVEDKAATIIEGMQSTVAEVQSIVENVENPVTVFVMDSNNGNEIYTTSFGLQSNLIELAGGVNVTKGEADSRWFNTSVETLVDKNPDFIIFNEYGTQPIEEKIAFINDNPALVDVTAVKEQNYIVIPLQNVMQDVRAAESVRIFAEAFYPDLFQ